MKALTLLISLILSLPAFSCTDQEADFIVHNRATLMAKRYKASQFGIGTSMQWDTTRITTITIPNGDSGNGEKTDRIGSIYINMDNCVVEAKLIGIYDTFNVD